MKQIQQKDKVDIKKEDAEAILVNFLVWYVYDYKETKKHKTIGDIIKYYLRKEKDKYNDK